MSRYQILYKIRTPAVEWCIIKVPTNNILKIGTQWYSKCRGYYQLSPGSFWRSESAEGIYIHKCRNIHTENPWHIYRTVANQIIFPSEQLALNKYQIRIRLGIERYWLIMHWFITCAVCIPGNTIPSRINTGIFKIKSKQSESVICTSS